MGLSEVSLTSCLHMISKRAYFLHYGTMHQVLPGRERVVFERVSTPCTNSDEMEMIYVPVYVMFWKIVLIKQYFILPAKY